MGFSPSYGRFKPPGWPRYRNSDYPDLGIECCPLFQDSANMDPWTGRRYFADRTAELGGSGYKRNGISAFGAFLEPYWNYYKYLIPRSGEGSRKYSTEVVFLTGSTVADQQLSEWVDTSISHDKLLEISGSKLKFSIYDGATKTLTGTTTLAANTYYHVVGTSDGSGTIQLWLNGLSEGTLSVGTVQVYESRLRVGHSGDVRAQILMASAAPLSCWSAREVALRFQRPFDHFIFPQDELPFLVGAAPPSTLALTGTMRAALRASSTPMFLLAGTARAATRISAAPSLLPAGRIMTRVTIAPEPGASLLALAGTLTGAVRAAAFGTLLATGVVRTATKASGAPTAIVSGNVKSALKIPGASSQAAFGTARAATRASSTPTLLPAGRVQTATRAASSPTLSVSGRVMTRVTVAPNAGASLLLLIGTVSAAVKAAVTPMLLVAGRIRAQVTASMTEVAVAAAAVNGILRKILRPVLRRNQRTTFASQPTDPP